MQTLAERIRAQKAQTGEKPREHQVAPQHVDLRGTGITKREAAKNTREYQRQEKASLKAVDNEAIHEAEANFERGVAETVRIMREAQRAADIILDESQERAVTGIVHNKVSVLIGAAGTGKTTVTKIVIGTLEKLFDKVQNKDVTWVTIDFPDGHKERMRESDAIKRSLKDDYEEEIVGIAGAAYTGRATQQFRRAVPEDWKKNISTIHSLLGYAPVYEEFEFIDPISGLKEMRERRVFRPSFDASCKLPYQMYILDEASMIPIPLFNELVDAIHETSRILLIGDIHQLPPVYGKSVLGYAMRKWPVFELTTIHRQAAGNAIISNAHNVLAGRPLNNAKNFHIIGNAAPNISPSGQSELQPYMLKVIRKLSDIGRYNVYTDAIIVPQNKGMVGQEELNQHLVTIFNPEIKEGGIIVNKRIQIHTGTGHVHFAARDKVMITQNINEAGITNGMIGIVESININGRYDIKRAQVDFSDGEDANDELDLDFGNFSDAMSKALGDEKTEKKGDESQDQRQSSHVMTIKFESGQTYTCSTAGDYRKVQHGYAATCHKSQGGEYPNIIILCHSVNARMLTREWLYTAVTRARENVYIICNSRGLDQALKNEVIKGRTLAEKIQSYIVETHADEDEVTGLNFDRSKFPILWEPEKV